MRIKIAIFLVIMWSTLSGCDSSAISTENKLSNELIVTPSEIKIRYGDGTLQYLYDVEKIEYITNLIHKNEYEPIKIPDSVGPNFTLFFPGGQQYSSSGYLKIENTYYKSQNTDMISKLNIFIMSLKKE